MRVSGSSLFLPAAFALAAALLTAAPVGAADVEVKMLNRGDAGPMVFEPALVEVSPGDSVTFVPVDKGHNAETIPGMLPEGAEPFKGRINEEITVTFEVPGAYGIKCLPHLAMGMVMLVVVGDEPTNLDDISDVQLPPLARRRMDAALAELEATPASPEGAQALTELWRTVGFSMPESVSYDPDSDAFYASNINSPDMSANGEGYITRLGPDGGVIEERFATGLNAPKGTFVREGILYVAGIEEVVEIDLASGEVTVRHAIPGASFVNDVAVADDGTIYATETMQGAIYSISDGTVTQLVADPALAGANGIVIDGNRLLVATLGDISQGFANLQPSNVKAVDISTAEVTDYGSDEPVGTLDGIELTSGGVLVTDNGGGKLLMVSEDGTVTEIGSTGAGSADFEYVPGSDLVVVPLLNTGEVVAFSLGSPSGSN